MLTFKRGVHPPDAKGFSAEKEIVMIQPEVGEELCFPMSQHIGAPCKPIVAKGDYVKVGQKIGETTGFVCSPIFASVSGTVKDIKPVITPGGGMSEAVIIENDGEMALADGRLTVMHESAASKYMIGRLLGYTRVFCLDWNALFTP